MRLIVAAALAACACPAVAQDAAPPPWPPLVRCMDIHEVMQSQFDLGRKKGLDYTWEIYLSDVGEPVFSMRFDTQPGRLFYTFGKDGCLKSWEQVPPLAPREGFTLAPRPGAVTVP